MNLVTEIRHTGCSGTSQIQLRLALVSYSKDVSTRCNVKSKPEQRRKRLRRRKVKLLAHPIQHAFDDIRNVDIHSDFDFWSPCPTILYVPLFPARVLHCLALCKALSYHPNLAFPPSEELWLYHCHKSCWVMCKDGIYPICFPAAAPLLLPCCSYIKELNDSRSGVERSIKP